MEGNKDMFRFYNSLLVVLLPLLVVISVDSSMVLETSNDVDSKAYFHIAKRAEARSEFL